MYYVIGSLHNGDKRKYFTQYSIEGEFRPELITDFHPELTDPRNERAWLIGQDRFLSDLEKATDFYNKLRRGRFDISELPEEL